MSINRAEFIISVGKNGNYPERGHCEIAMVGRSNVGKSSLINALTGRSKLAKTSQQPGKTRLINYFLIDDAYYLVDLPGYGYANAPESEIESWRQLIEEYLQSGRVAHIFLLLDIRHAPTEQDRQMFHYVQYHAIPYTLIATKADKLSQSKRAAGAAAVTKAMGAISPAVYVSSESKQGLEEVRAKMRHIAEDYSNMEKHR